MMIFYYHTGWYMEKIIKEIVKETLKLNVNKEINDNDDLINLGLDSLKAIEIVVSIEEKFQIEIDDEDLLVDNFASINCIENLIEKYKR